MHRSLLAPLVLTGALLPLSSASAATLTSSAPSCARSGAPFDLVGSGFTPNGTVSTSLGDATADATGSISGTFHVPSDGGLRPSTQKVTATDDANPALAATFTLRYVGFFFTNFPITGRPKDRVQWKFAGFDAGKPIYGHFRYRARTQANYRFGLAKGACGTLSTFARRLPTTSHPGAWSVQFDQKRIYSPKTTPRRTATFTITRSFA